MPIMQDASTRDDQQVDSSSRMGTGAISWSAKKQATVANSSTEAEYVSASSVGREIIWLWNLLREIGFSLDKPSPMMVDNQSAIKVL
jgi:hypothetical protein